MTDMDDVKYMKLALKLARRAVGFTEPNPLVGAVVVKDGKVLGTGYHRRYGDRHAEREALDGVDEKNTTLYITLEPCSHQGKTPPCTGLILEKKVGRVVAAMKDPNPLVNGKGLAMLQEQGVQVETGILEDHARKLNRHYIKYITQKLPYVALKAGASLDGKLTDKFGKSQWVTDEHLRKISHSLRGEFGAIMVGLGTALDDNPQLTIREPGWEGKNFFRVVLDTQNAIPRDMRIFDLQDQFPLVIFSSNKAENQTPKIVNHYFVNPGKNGGLDLHEVLKELYALGIASVMVEGGGRLFSSFLSLGLYDELILSQAGTLIGGKESVELFAEGAPVSAPIILKDREIINLDTGHIVRGYKE